MIHRRHFKTLCKGCGKLLAQCRCMAVNKDISYALCNECQAAQNDRPYTTGCIINNHPDGAWIQCLDCKRKSYHPKDIEHKYCGFCHKFHPESL